jgi:hypothetical protein
MPRYNFILKNGQPEDHEFELPNDALAIEEALRTASGLLRDIDFSEVGKNCSQSLEIRESGDTVMKIEIHAVKNR